MKHNFRKYAWAVALTGPLVIASSLSGQIVVQNFTEQVDSDTTDAIHTISDFTVTAGDNRKLVLVVGNESASGINSITWNGGETFISATNPVNTRRTRIFYLDAPTVGTSNIVITFSGTNVQSRVGVLSLTNAASGGPVVSNVINNGSASASLTTNVANTFVVGGLTVNDNISAGPAALTQLYLGGSGSSWSHAGYQNQSIAGTVDYSWTTNSTGTNIGGLSIVGFATAIPEPTSFAALFGLAALGLVATHRRRDRQA